MPDTYPTGHGFETGEENEVSSYLTRIIRKRLSISNIGISDIDLVRYWNGS
jgi:hypothetical protein